MSSEQLALQLTETREASVLITGKPSHDDIVCICEALTPLLLQAGYNKAHAKHNLWGIIAPTEAYIVKYGEPFDIPERISAYPPILQYTIDQTRKLKAVWNICIKDYAFYDTGVSSVAAFILASVNDVWFRELRDPTTFYTNVLTFALLAHIEERCTELHAIGASDLPLIIQGYYADILSMPVYVNMLENAQRKSLSTDLPLSDATLLATATKADFAL